MKLSNRIKNISVSPTIAIATKAREMKSAGVDVVNYGAGEPDFDTPSFIKNAAIKALEEGDTKYNPKKGRDLKKAIVEKLKKENGIDVEPSQVLVAFGGKHALYSAFQVTVDPGDKVLVPAPYWVSYPEQVKLAGGEPVILKSSPEAGFKIRPQQIRDHAADASVLILNSPGNPSGVMYSREELEAIAEVVLESDMSVFSDEIYEKLVYTDKEFVSFASLDKRLEERTLTFNGLSKAFSMTGWRLGWVAGPQNVISSMAKLLSQATTNPVSFAQAGALAAYIDPSSANEIEKMRVEFGKRGKHMMERLNNLAGVKCCRPEGAFYCFPDVSENYGRKLGNMNVTDSMSFAEAALESKQVAMVPGCAFGEDRCVRLSFATNMEQIDKGLDRLEEFLA